MTTRTLRICATLKTYVNVQLRYEPNKCIEVILSIRTWGPEAEQRLDIYTCLHDLVIYIALSLCAGIW
jgi:hypothetical protein